MTQDPQFENLSPAAAYDVLHQGRAVLIDVREADEYAAEHIPGALLHPLSSFNPAALPQGLPLILQCGSGKRSATAMARCQAVGGALPRPCRGRHHGLESGGPAHQPLIITPGPLLGWPGDGDAWGWASPAPYSWARDSSS